MLEDIASQNLQIFVYDCIMRGNCYYFCARNTIGGPKMSGNFVHCKRERHTLPLALAVHEISRHFWAAYGNTNKICRLYKVIFSTLQQLQHFAT